MTFKLRNLLPFANTLLGEYFYYRVFCWYMSGPHMSYQQFKTRKST